MGEHEVSSFPASKTADFMRILLADLWTLEKMLETSEFDSTFRIGAEQEIFLINSAMKPAPIGPSILKKIADPRITTELAKFNLEMNLTPQILAAGCFENMERELLELITKIRAAAAEENCDVALTGILPTIASSDLTVANMTDTPRYRELDRALNQLRGNKYSVHIKGLDEIHCTHENMMMEAANTSFQLHFQVSPENFADAYNIAQAISGPVLAAAVNSPFLFGKRLWSETRLALFQHSVDERSEIEQSRFRLPRVSFGDRWIERSPLEIFKEDIARFRVLLTHDGEKDPCEVLACGGVPKLGALRLHAGTIWRWNRPCYGIMNGKPHLRIENRHLPSGPTVVDEMANAAFFAGLMFSLKEEFGPIHRRLQFEFAKSNFFAAARHGLNAQMHWLDGNVIPAGELILKQLLPLARTGLKSKGISDTEIDRYLPLIGERVRSQQTGAQWMINAVNSMGEHGTPELRYRTLTAAMTENEKSFKPVHLWPQPQISELKDLGQTYRTVGQFMTTDLFTVRSDDIADYVASIMYWEHIRHVPVEDSQGQLVGLVSQRNLLLLLAQGSLLNRAEAVPVHRIMKRDLVTVTPTTSTIEAVDLMRSKRIGCLPVVENGKLVGIVTLFDLLKVSSKLLESSLEASSDPRN